MIASLLFCALLAPQDPAVGPAVPTDPLPTDPLPFEQVEGGGRLRIDVVDGVGGVSAWLTLGIGSDHDPRGATGLARVLGEVLRAELPAPTPERPAEVAVTDRAILAGVLLEPGAVEAHLDRVGRWLRGALELDDDALLEARGRALLRADDEAAVLPGPLLRERAERLLFPDAPIARPGGGVPEQIRALEPAAIRAAFHRACHPSRATLVLVGAVDPDGARAAARRALGADREPEPWQLVGPEAGGPPVDAVTASDRVDAAFVLHAFRAPQWGDADYLPFLLAMEVVRSRAVATFRTPRGGEHRAEFPPLAYDFLRMPKTASIGRRGRNGEPPGPVHDELDSLIAGLRSGGADTPEVQSALGILLGTLDVPPFRPELTASLRRYPGLLHQRGYVLAWYGLHGWPADLTHAIGSVPLGRIDAVLRAALAPDRGVRVGLRPPE